MPPSNTDKPRRTPLPDRDIARTPYRELLNETVRRVEWRAILSAWALGAFAFALFERDLTALGLGLVVLLALILGAPVIWKAVMPELQWRRLVVLGTAVVNAAVVVVLLAVSPWLCAAGGVLFACGLLVGHAMSENEAGGNERHKHRQPERRSEKRKDRKRPHQKEPRRR